MTTNNNVPIPMNETADQPVAAEEASGVVGREELVSAPAQHICKMYTRIVPSEFSRTVSEYRYAPPPPKAGYRDGKKKYRAVKSSTQTTKFPLKNLRE